MSADSNWKLRTLLIGGAIGALTGVAAAYLIVRRAEGEEREVHLEARDGLRLGLLVLGMLRQVASIGEK